MVLVLIQQLLSFSSPPTLSRWGYAGRSANTGLSTRIRPSFRPSRVAGWRAYTLSAAKLEWMNTLGLVLISSSPVATVAFALTVFFANWQDSTRWMDSSERPFRWTAMLTLPQ